MITNTIDTFIAHIAPSLDRKSERLWTSRELLQVDYPDEIHDDYARIEESSYWFGHRNTCICSVVGRFPPSGPILDVGGGNGIVSLALNGIGVSSIVLEPGGRGVHIALSRELPVIQATLQTAQIRDASVPAVGLFDVLEHIRNDSEALGDIHRCLKPEGRLYVTVPAYEFLWSIEDKKAGHARRYTLSRLRADLSAAGFRTTYATYMFSPLVAPIFLMRSLPTFFGHRDSARAATADHSLPRGIVGKSIGKWLTLERARIASGGSIPFGSSILVAAQKAG